MPSNILLAHFTEIISGIFQKLVNFIKNLHNIVDKYLADIERIVLLDFIHHLVSQKIEE
jgi:hypothetical protein